MICSCVLDPAGERLTRSCLKKTVTAVRSQASINITVFMYATMLYALLIIAHCALERKSARESSIPEVNLGGSLHACEIQAVFLRDGACEFNFETCQRIDVKQHCHRSSAGTTLLYVPIQLRSW